MREAAYGCDPHRTPYVDLIRMRHSKRDLLSYAKNTLKHQACDDLAKLGREELYMRLWSPNCSRTEIAGTTSSRPVRCV